MEDQVDTYFKVPLGRLKMREITGARAQLIYYRRDESRSRMDCAYQIATVSDPSGLRAVLTSALGLDVRVAKRREVYWLEGIKINLDEVERLGCFIEFEARVREGEHRSAVRRVKDLMRHFGIEDEDALKCSYADMIRKLG